jgi:hypothetical protein
MLAFLLLYLAVATSTALVTPPLLSWLDIQPARWQQRKEASRSIKRTPHSASRFLA